MVWRKFPFLFLALYCFNFFRKKKTIEGPVWQTIDWMVKHYARLNENGKAKRLFLSSKPLMVSRSSSNVFFFLFFRANKFLAIKGTSISLQLINVILYAIVTHAILWRRFSAPLYILCKLFPSPSLKNCIPHSEGRKKHPQAYNDIQ